MKNQIRKLATMLGMAGIDGTAIVAAASGIFQPKNIPLIAVLFIAGPGAILLASLTQGSLKERLFVALVSGAIATSIIMLAAGVGPRVLDFVNPSILKLFGGIGVFMIGLMIIGIKVPTKFPLLTILSGLVIGLIWR